MDNDPAEQPLDATDARVLDEIAALYEAVDPVPPRLLEQLSFSVALDELYTEVAEMRRVDGELVGVRSEAPAQRAATLTFAAESLTAMVTVTHLGPDRVRVDGWVAPPQPLEVRLRMVEERRTTEANDSGRFSFTDVPDGFVQLSFHPRRDGEDGVEAVVTPSFEL